MSHPLPIQLADCWAKTDPESGEPVVSITEHSLNAWAVGSELSRVLAPVGIPDQVLAWCCGLHDVGKISLGFLAKSSVWLRAMGLTEQSRSEGWANGVICDNHGRFTGQHLLLLRPSADPNHRKFAVLLASHHGTILPANTCLNALEHPMHKAKMNSLRHELHSWLQNQTGLPLEIDPVSIPTTDGLLFALAGWTTICDWIASNVDFFKPGNPVSALSARMEARKALSALGWFQSFTRGSSFDRVFPADRSPRPVQERLGELATQPGIYIVEAQMGDGKTKAALWAAHRLMSENKARGLYFALPTQVTSERVREEAVIPFVHHGFESGHAVRLIHSMAWFHENRQFKRILPGGNEGNGSVPIEDWFSGRKRALLAPFAVGTIDQALVGVLPRKHFFVRLAGLSGKVVVLDEVHSYDLYTGTLLCRLVNLLSQCGSTIIILSATLASRQRSALLEAAGFLAPDANDGENTGTRITWGHWRDRSQSGKTPTQAEVDDCPASFKEQNVRIHFTQSDSEVIAEDLVRRAARGEKVLWIRNSVANAMAAFRECATRAETPGEDIPCGILHSRFTWQDRQANETRWIERFQCGVESGGCVLVTTQVAEQSLNLDADFLVSDIAPTDLLLQRIGRLWRFRGRSRPAGCCEPVCQVNSPRLDPAGAPRELVEALAPLARVYDPYVLLRTLEIWQLLDSLVLPRDIRILVEKTYAERAPENEPAPSWAELAEKARGEAAKIEALAIGLSDIWQRLSLEDDDDDAQTRRIRFPTLPLILLQKRLSSPGSSPWIFANGREIMLPEAGRSFAETVSFRRAVLENSVKIPGWLLPRGETWFPRELIRIRGLDAAVAWLDGERVLPWSSTDSSASWMPGFTYHPSSGLSLPPTQAATSRPCSNPWDPGEDDW
jgi:CRISPR-associated endonuclease/helicase Cas3